MSYKDTLTTLKLSTLAYRRAKGDLKETHKILRGKYDDVSNFIPLREDSNTMGS